MLTALRRLWGLFSSYIWKPDPYFRGQIIKQEVTALAFNTINERFFATRFVDNANLKLVYSTQVKVNVICDMHFENFPFDSQNCAFFLKSLKSQKTIRKNKTIKI